MPMFTWFQVSLTELYRKIYDMIRTLVGNEIVSHSDVVEASPVGASPTTSSFLTDHLASIDCAMIDAIWDKNI